MTTWDLCSEFCLFTKAGSGNLISTTSSVTELAPQNGSIPAQIFSVGGVAERVRSGILTLTDNDGSGFVGAHEVGFISPPQSGSPGASACVATSNLARNQDATQSSEFGNNAFPAANALDGNFANFTHTAPSQAGASWEVELQSNSIIDNVVLHNRGGCCKSRLRDITVSVINSSGTTVFQSPLLNPENTANSPNQIAVDISSLSGEAVVGNTIRIDRTSDPDLSGVNSTGGILESDVLSLAEVEVFGCVN